VNKSLEYLDYRISEIKKQIKNARSQLHQQGMDLLLLLLEPNHHIRITAFEALQHSYFASSKVKTTNFDSFVGNSTASPYYDSSKVGAQIKPSIHVYKGKETIVIQLSESQISSSSSQDGSLKTDSGHLNLSKINSFQGNNSLFNRNSNQLSPPLAHGSGSRSVLFVRQSSSLTSDARENGENFSFQGDHKMTKSPGFRKMKSNIGDEDKENVGINQGGMCSNSAYLTPDRFSVQTRARSDITKSKTGEFFKEDSSPDTNEEEEEEESELSEDIEDEACKVGFYIENLKNLEILKPETKMSRYV